MHTSEGAYYPCSHYTNIAFFCANHLTRVLSPKSRSNIYLFNQHGGWQSHLRETIERVLHRACLEDSVAIGALVLMEKLYDSTWPKQPYPDGVYLKYFLAAYALAQRSLSRTRRPLREGFWADVFAGIMTPHELPTVTRTFVRALKYDTKISEGHFIEMHGRMYAFLGTHMRMRAGERYERAVGVVPVLPDSSAEFDLPPYFEEVLRRRHESGIASTRNHSDGERLLFSKIKGLSNIDILDQQSHYGTDVTTIAR